MAFTAVKSSSYSSGVNVELAHSALVALPMQARWACQPEISSPEAMATEWFWRSAPILAQSNPQKTQVGRRLQKPYISCGSGLSTTSIFPL